MNDNFKIILDGKETTAHIFARLDVEETGIEYIYYYIDGDEEQKFLMAARVETDGEEEVLIPIETKEENKLAFDIFSKCYEKINK